ncbi:MAG: ATP-binding protein [Acidimicrobiales bacterium]
MPRTTLPPDPTSAAAGRRFVADVLWQRGFPTEVIDDAVLLTSEAITNAVVHAGTAVDVVVAVDSLTARVEIHDRRPGAAEVVHAAAEAPRGRGLRVVAAVADAWGCRPTGSGKCVWFELRP